jgi:hypothetical protein
MNPSIFASGIAAGAGNSGFWGSIANKLGSLGATTVSSGSGSGTTGGNTSKKFNWKDTVGDVGTSMATAGLSSAVGGLMGSGDESGEDKYTSQKAHSEGVTRKFEAKNSAPTAAIGNYMARALALQGMPVLGALNNLDFMSKVFGYGKDYYPKALKGIGNLLGGRK